MNSRLDLNQQVVLSDRIANLHRHTLDDSVGAGSQLVLHLHGLKDHETIADFHFLARLYHHREHESGHRCPNLTVLSVGTGLKAHGIQQERTTVLPGQLALAVDCTHHDPGVTSGFHGENPTLSAVKDGKPAIAKVRSPKRGIPGFVEHQGAIRIEALGSLTKLNEVRISQHVRARLDLNIVR